MIEGQEPKRIQRKKRRNRNIEFLKFLRELGVKQYTDKDFNIVFNDSVKKQSVSDEPIQNPVKLPDYVSEIMGGEFIMDKIGRDRL